MDPFIPRRAKNAISTPTECPIFLLDGGLGTTLADQHACTFDDTTPLWSSHLLISSPSTLLKAQTAFANAGADIILSATYQASYEGFARTGDGIGEEEAGGFMRRGVSIAREAFRECGRKGRVALSLGAYGATMVPSQEYSGKYDEERMGVEGLRRWHVRRLQVFLPWSGEGRNSIGDGLEGLKSQCWNEVDVVAFETLPLLAEIEAVRRAMDAVEEERAFWISCVFPGEGYVLPDGSSVKEVVRTMLGRGEGMAVPMGVGINCTKVGKVEGLIEVFEREIGVLVESGEAEWPALVVYPDGTNGEVYDTVRKEWVKGKAGGSESEMSWDEKIFEIVARAKARGLWTSVIVGGCCKTTPEDIGKLRRRID